MNWLEAALAFSLIMLALATVVTIVLETGYQILSTRERGFRLMMERLFDDVLSKRIATTLSGVSMEAARAQFLASVTRNQAYSEKTHWLRSIAQSADLKSMTMMQLAERLADTHVGQAIARTGADRTHIIINDLAQKFDRFGQGASQRFQGQAHFWCLLVSLLCAFVANVDAVVVFKSLLHDDTLTQGVIEKLGGSVDENAPRPRSAAEAMAAVPAPADESTATPKELAEAGAARVRVELARVNDAGLPVSSEYWPFCRAKSAAAGGAESPLSRDPRCSDGAQRALPADIVSVASRIFSISGLQWFLSVCLAGLLIGLGAPFWFDLARSLTRTAQSRSVSSEAANAGAPAGSAAAAGSPPRTPVDAFSVAIAAARPFARRVLLSPDGQPARGVRK